MLSGSSGDEIERMAADIRKQSSCNRVGYVVTKYEPRFPNAANLKQQLQLRTHHNLPAAAIRLNAVIGSGNARAINAVVKPQWRRGESNIGGELDLAAMNKPIEAGGICVCPTSIEYVRNVVCGGAIIANVIHALVLRAQPLPSSK